MTSFPCQVLFSPSLGPNEWRGKAFRDDGTGTNRFDGETARDFKWSIADSNYDGRPALVLDYAAAGEPLWGRVLGMRDELREVEPGLWLGLGSMTATGGHRNCAPFLLRSTPDGSKRPDDVGPSDAAPPN